MPSWARQAGYQVRFEWGAAGVEALGGEYVAVVDVLRFTTAVEAAVSKGAMVYPYRWKDASAAAFALELGAVLAGPGDSAGPTLSPVRLLTLAPGTRLVLPSPNGSTCAAIAGEAGATVVAACLRNARAVSAWLNDRTTRVTVIACGERWPNGSMRPSLEDCLGAGAIIAGLAGSRSPEAAAAAAVWEDAKANVSAALLDCSSGRELQERGWLEDVKFAAEVNASSIVPILRNGAFVHDGDAATRAQ